MRIRCFKVFRTTDHEGVEAAACIGAVVLGMGCMVCACTSASWLPVAVAPLGDVIGMVVK